MRRKVKSDLILYDTTMLKFDTVLQTFRTQILGSIISAKVNQRDGNSYGKINDEQNQQEKPWENLGHEQIKRRLNGTGKP